MSARLRSPTLKGFAEKAVAHFTRQPWQILTECQLGKLLGMKPQFVLETLREELETGVLVRLEVGFGNIWLLGATPIHEELTD